MTVDNSNTPQTGLIEQAVAHANSTLAAKRRSTVFYPTEQNVTDWLAGKLITPSTKKGGQLPPFTSTAHQDLAFCLVFFHPFMKTHLHHQTFKLNINGNDELLYTPDFYVEYKDPHDQSHRAYIDFISDQTFMGKLPQRDRERLTYFHESWCAENNINAIQIDEAALLDEIDYHFLSNIKDLFYHRFNVHPVLRLSFVPLLFEVQRCLKGQATLTIGDLITELEKLNCITDRNILRTFIKYLIARHQLHIDLYQEITDDRPLGLRQSVDLFEEPFFLRC